MSRTVEKTLYLFNSGLHPGYIQNIRRTMLLPSGCVNEYRYRATRNVSQDLIKTLPTIKPGHSALIIFVDRFDKSGYVFIPLRQARYLGCRRDGDQVFITVALENWLSPLAPSAFNLRLNERLDPLGLPRLTDNDTRNKNDGNYLILGPDLISDRTQYDFGDTAWDSTADRILKTDAFWIDGDSCLFRATLTGVTRSVPFRHPKKANRAFRLRAGEQYAIMIRYRCVGPAPSPVIKLGLTPEQNVNILGQDRVIVDMEANSVPIRFAVSKRSGHQQGAFRLDLSQGAEPVGQFEIPYYVGSSRETVLLWTGLTIGYVVVQTVAVTGPLETFLNSWWPALTQSPWWMLRVPLLAAFQFGVIVLAIRLTGQKCL